LIALTTSSHSHDGTRPVIAPKMTSPTSPIIMSFFLPNLSEYPPRIGDSSMDMNMKADVKRPIRATDEPRDTA